MFLFCLKAKRKVFDTDGSGKISAQELKKVMLNLGEKLTDEEIDEMIREADTDGDGETNQNSLFRGHVTGYISQSGTRRSDLMGTVAAIVFDKDGNGKISSEELKIVMQNLGERLTDEEINEMIREADNDGDGEVFDKNGDGKISSVELRDVMVSLGEKLTDDEIDQANALTTVLAHSFERNENRVRPML
eukprot:sb/3471133/